MEMVFIHTIIASPLKITFRESMKKNADWIVQVHAKDDHLVPVREARFVHEHV